MYIKRIFFIILFIPLISHSQINDNLQSIYLDINETEDAWTHAIPNFYPIGWSKDGKFAYKITRCDDMCGCCTNGISIIDAITDQEVEYLDFGEGGGEFPDITTKDSSIKVRETLLRNDIVIGSVNTLINSEKINNYNIVLHQKKLNIQKYSGSDIEYNLMVGNNKIGYKTVSKGLIEDNHIDLQYLGYFINPYEDRILILISSCQRGIELTDYHYLNFFGCNLNPKTF